MLDLKKALLIIPYIVKHPGVTLDRLSKRFAIPKKQLRKMLETISLCGVPDYTPADLIEVDIENNRVSIRFADFLSEPVNLSISESLAILLSIDLLVKAKAMNIKALTSVADKIKNAFGKGKKIDVAKLQKLIDISITPQLDEETWDEINRTISGHFKARMKYHNIAKDIVTDRVIEPYQMVFARGQWYLIANCLKDNMVKTFRADRILKYKPTKEHFKPKNYDPQRFTSTIYLESEKDLEVKLRFNPLTVSVIKEKWPKTKFTDEEDGSSILSLRVSSYKWVIKEYLLPYMQNVEIVEPEELKKEFVKEIRELKKLYAS